MLRRSTVAGVECWSVLIRHEVLKTERAAQAWLLSRSDETLGGRVIRPGRPSRVSRWYVQLVYEDPDPTGRVLTGFARLSIPTTASLADYGIPLELGGA